MDFKIDNETSNTISKILLLFIFISLITFILTRNIANSDGDDPFESLRVQLESQPESQFQLGFISNIFIYIAIALFIILVIVRMVTELPDYESKDKDGEEI